MTGTVAFQSALQNDVTNIRKMQTDKGVSTFVAPCLNIKKKQNNCILTNFMNTFIKDILKKRYVELHLLFLFTLVCGVSMYSNVSGLSKEECFIVCNKTHISALSTGYTANN